MYVQCVIKKTYTSSKRELNQTCLSKKILFSIIIYIADIKTDNDFTIL